LTTQKKPKIGYLGYVLLWLLLLSYCSSSSIVAADSDASSSSCEAKDEQCTWPSPDDENTEKIQTFRAFLERIDAIVVETSSSTSSSVQRAQQERLILSTLMEHVGMMDAAASFIDQRPLKQNWMEELHNRTLALGPPAFWKVFLRKPPEEEFDAIVQLDVYAQQSSNSLKELRTAAFAPHRKRGMAAALSISFSSSVLQSLQHLVGYATPTNAVLELLAKDYAPIVEVGAGNGYWSAALQELYGADVVAYDLEPPPPPSPMMNTNDDDANTNQNLFSFANRAFTNVQRGTCASIFQQQQDTTTTTAISKRSLLLIWPNNPDQVDNAQLYYSNPTNQEQPPPPTTWDVDCLLSYLEAGGSTVIYVGERETQISVRPERPPDSGMSSSRQFQILLAQHLDLIEQHTIPTWWGVDDVTIWKKR
jgi:hypothetical protein